MKITIIEARKLFKELKKKYPEKDCGIEIKFNSWSKEHISAYISDSEKSCIKNYNSANEIREYFNL